MSANAVPAAVPSRLHRAVAALVSRVWCVTSKPTMVTRPRLSSASEASGSWLTFASDHGVVLPLVVRAPPIITTRSRSAREGSAPNAAAMFVDDPVGTYTRSAPWRRADSTMKSTAPPCSAGRGESGIRTPPRPLSPWMRRTRGDGSKESAHEAHACPANTGMSVRPSSARTASELRTASSVVTLP